MLYAIAINTTGHYNPIKYEVCEFAAVCVDTGDTFHSNIEVTGPWEEEEAKEQHSTRKPIPWYDFIPLLNEWLGSGFHEWVGFRPDDELYLRHILGETKIAHDGCFSTMLYLDKDQSLLMNAQLLADRYR